MGRRKIAIAPLTDERNRSVTFLKRKAGLFKKAHELATLCSAEIAVIIFGPNGRLYEFTTGNTERIIDRYLKTSPTEKKDSKDYQKGDGCVSGNESDNNSASQSPNNHSRSNSTRRETSSPKTHARQSSAASNHVRNTSNSSNTPRVKPQQVPPPQQQQPPPPPPPQPQPQPQYDYSQFQQPPTRQYQPQPQHPQQQQQQQQLPPVHHQQQQQQIQNTQYQDRRGGSFAPEFNFPAVPAPPPQRPQSVDIPPSQQQQRAQENSGMRPKLKVRIPSEDNSQGIKEEKQTSGGSASATATGPRSAGPSSAGGLGNGQNLTLPPPSPSSYLTGQQNVGPGNPFSRPPLLPAEQTPQSSLPSRYVNDLLPSPNGFYDWFPNSGFPNSATQSHPPIVHAFQQQHIDQLQQQQPPAQQQTQQANHGIPPRMRDLANNNEVLPSPLQFSPNTAAPFKRPSNEDGNGNDPKRSKLKG